MRRLAIWLDDYALASLPGVEQGLARMSAIIMRSFSRIPNPAMVGQFEQYQQVAVIGAKSHNELLARIELATTTLRIGIIAVLPSGVSETSLLRHPGLVDIIPSRCADAAKRISLMADVPIVTGGMGKFPSVPVPPKPALGAATNAGPAPVVPGVTTPKPPPASGSTAAKLLQAAQVTPLAPFRPLGGDAMHNNRPPVAIASSTGGSWVLVEILRGLDRRRVGPVLLAQHMESEFLPFFAQWLSTTIDWPTIIVDAHTRLLPEAVFLAAGGRDLCVDANGVEVFSAESSSRFVPCADRLFRTLSKALGPRSMGVVLSGMGSDGAAGLGELVRGGGKGLCQLPSTAVVPSMPESALKAARDAIAIPPGLIATALMQE